MIGEKHVDQHFTSHLLILQQLDNQQSARTHPARDQAADGRRLSGWAIGPKPRRRQAAPHHRHRVSTKRYLDVGLLKDQQMRGAITA